MRNPFARLAKRDTARLSLRERAATLKASATRVIKRKAADPFEGTSCPEGFVPYPLDNPMSYSSIQGVVIPAEAQRLLDLALGEYERCCGSFADFVSEERRESIRKAKRTALHIDALTALVQSMAAPGITVARPSPQSDGSGFVIYQDGVGRPRRETVAYWIAATALDLDGIARREVSRQFNAACNDLSREDCDALYDRLRKEHRIDALHDLAFRSDRVFEVCKEYAVGHRWRVVGKNADAELLALGREFDALHAEWVPAQVAANAATIEPGSSEVEDRSIAIELRMERVAAQIRALPARTLDGLAVKARAAIPSIWTKGQYQEDAGLGDEEDWLELNARSVINECLHLAGVDWTGRRFRPSSPMAAEDAASLGTDQPALTPKASAEAVDLSDFSVADLGAFYRKLGGARELWGAAMSEPRAIADRQPFGTVSYTPYGERADDEDNRIGHLRGRVADEAARRTGADRDEGDELLAIRIEHEIECEGRIKDDALLADIAKAWA